MAVSSFIFLIVFTSIYFEVIAGTMGIILPLTAIAIFYLAITFGWKRGILLSVLAGTVIDMLYGRSIIVSPYLMIFTVAASMFWLHKGDPVSILPNLIPGATASFLVTFPLLAVNTYRTELYTKNAFILLVAVISGGFLLPIMIAFFDYLAEKQGLPLYRKAKAAAMDQR
jgi:hypothetical protein